MNPHLMYESYHQSVRDLCRGNPNLEYLDQFWTAKHQWGCRIAIFEFGVENNRIIQCTRSNIEPGCRTNAEHFLSDFTSDRLPHRRLFLVEDLTPEVIEALGSKFDIDPAFFAGHIRITEGDSVKGESNIQKLPSFCDPHKQFLLKYWDIFGPHTAHATEDIGGSGKKVLVQSSNVKRKLWIRPSFPGNDGKKSKKKGQGSNEKEQQLTLVRCKASFWSRTHEDGSWDTVILVDPGWRRNRHHNYPNDHVSTQFQNGYIDFTPWTTSSIIPKSPPRTSIFDDIIFYLKEEWPHSNLGRDPGDAAIFLRKIVVSTWMVSIEFLKRDYATVLLDDLDYSITLDVSTIQENVRNLHNATSLTIRFWSQAKQNLFNLGIAPKDHQYYTRYPEGRILNEQQSEGRGTCQHRSRTEHRWQLDDDEVDWIYVFSELESWRKRYAGLTNVQLQTLNIYDTQRELQNSKYYSWLSLLGTVYLPVSLVTTMFAMVDDFSPGKSKFWVYWVVAVPVFVTAYIFFEVVKRSTQYPGSSTSFDCFGNRKKNKS